MDYAIWDLNAADLVTRPRRGMYQLSATGRARARTIRGRRGAPPSARRRTAAAPVARTPAAPVRDGKRLGISYRPANVGFRSRDPALFSYDPDARDRHTRAHHRVQEYAARAVRELGFEPRSPSRSDPQFDLAYDEDDRITVIEVKSLPRSYRDTQLRLGLGQVLEYALRLSPIVESVRPVLLVERRPPAIWAEICLSGGVLLAWPGRLRSVLTTGESRR